MLLLVWPIKFLLKHPTGCFLIQIHIPKRKRCMDGWPTRSSRETKESTSPALEFQICTTTPVFFFYMGSSNWTQALMLAWQTLHWLKIHRPSKWFSVSANVIHKRSDVYLIIFLCRYQMYHRSSTTIMHPTILLLKLGVSTSYLHVHTLWRKPLHSPLQLQDP